MNHYFLFFALLSLLCLSFVDDGEGPLRFAWIWPAVNTGFMAVAYGLNRPGLVCAKTPEGRLNPVLVFANLPWLALTWGIWAGYRAISKENDVDAIKGTNWSISSYPGWRYPDDSYDLVIDLTAEFPKPGGADDNYRCHPNLDGARLSDVPTDLEIGREARVLVHCAQGHGRSATWASLVMTRCGIFDDVWAAYAAIRASRPKATVSAAQTKQLFRILDEALQSPDH